MEAPGAAVHNDLVPSVDEASPAPPDGVSPAPARAPGLVVLAVLIVLGMSSAAYYHWKAPPEIAKLRAMAAEVPTAGEPRLEAWMRFGAPMIHNRLVYLRYSNAYPWLVTHVVESADAAPEIWGIDFRDLPQDVTIREGMQVQIRLPAAALLARGELDGDQIDRVLRVRPGEPRPDADVLAEGLVEFALRHPDDFIARLERDIPGASLVVQGGAYRPAGPATPTGAEGE